MAKRTTAHLAGAPATNLEAEVAAIAGLGIDDLRTRWRRTFGAKPPRGATKDLMMRVLTYRLQESALGGLLPQTARLLRSLDKPGLEPPRQVKVGSVLVREYGGVVHEVMVVPGGFCWRGQTYDSLSTIAKTITGTSWNGPRFFGLRGQRGRRDSNPSGPSNETDAQENQASGARKRGRPSLVAALQANEAAQTRQRAATSRRASTDLGTSRPRRPAGVPMREVSS